MISVFRITLTGSASRRYNVYRFFPDIYFVRSAVEQQQMLGFGKGVSIWKSNGRWISAPGHNPIFVNEVGEEIDKYNQSAHGCSSLDLGLCTNQPDYENT